jgi:uncharacterized membrane protein YccC
MKKSFLLFVLASILFGIGVEIKIPIIIGIGVIALVLTIVNELLTIKTELK